MPHIHWATGLVSNPVSAKLDQSIPASGVGAGHGGVVLGKQFDEAIGHPGGGAAPFSGDNQTSDVQFQNFVVRDRRAHAEQALHESRKELRRLSGLLCSIQEDERRRIALDLHDGLGQTLNLIKLSVENAARMAPTASVGAVAEALQQIIPRIGEALGEVRRVAMELRPPMLDDLGILPTLTWFLREFEAACGHLTVDKVFNITESDVPAHLKITLFRILQEATNNIVKHADASRVRISLDRRDDELHLLIDDNGRGFDPASAVWSDATGRGLGLLSMQERAAFSGGVYRLDSAPGEGTHIQVSWPCGPEF
jgi:signal transduction histidine kinase